ncbi:hypothetical protein ACOMHN_047161 [Nucella lapillus]
MSIITTGRRSDQKLPPHFQSPSEMSRGEPGGHTDPDPALSAAGAGHVCAVACLMMDPTQTYQHAQEVVSQDPVKLIEQTYISSPRVSTGPSQAD